MTTATKSTVTLEPHGGTSWTGLVKSSKTACKDNRSVSLYFETSGGGFKVGKDKSEPGPGNTYVWSVSDFKPHGSAYYAKIRPKDGCSGDKSKTVSYP